MMDSPKFIPVRKNSLLTGATICHFWLKKIENQHFEQTTPKPSRLFQKPVSTANFQQILILVLELPFQLVVQGEMQQHQSAGDLYSREAKGQDLMLYICSIHTQHPISHLTEWPKIWNPSHRTPDFRLHLNVIAFTFPVHQLLLNCSWNQNIHYISLKALR